LKGYITQIRQLTPDVRSFHIHIPGRPSYRPGQFLVWAIEAQGKLRKRAYSIASPPHWENIELLIKIHPQGKATPVIFGLFEGAEVEVELPFGTFYLDDHRLPRKMVFLAGGVGVSALLSMIRHLERIGYQGEPTLLFGCRTPADIVHREDLDRLARDWRLKLVYTIDHPDGTGWQGETGYITPEMIARHCDVGGSDFYMCGPPQMVAHMVENLERLAVSHERIHKEQW
jgi:propane monooxygenase reductase subunit